MAILSNTEILGLLENTRPDHELAKAAEYEDQLRFHSEKYKDTSDIGSYYWDYQRKFPKKLLPQDKATTFMTLMDNQRPVKTVPFVDSIIKKLSPVFYAPDRFIGFEFKSPELGRDFEKYLREIGDDTFWPDHGLKIMTNKPNSLMVVDLPMLEQDMEGNFIEVTTFPEPVYVTKDIKEVVHIENQPDGTCEWAMFTMNWDVNKIAIVDGAAYRMFVKPEESGDFELVYESFHGLGYAPCRQFWTANIGHSTVVKDAPLVKSLADLDYLLFSIISKQHADLYVSYPIMSIYESKCDYISEDGYSCNGSGKIEKTLVLEDDREKIVYESCPRCSERKLAGAGTVLQAPARADKDDPDMLQGVFIQQADTDALRQLNEDIGRQKDVITAHTVGIPQVSTPEEQAKNEFQVRQQAETRESVLMDVKANFEKIHHFLISTVGKLRYGDRLKGVTVNWGNEFLVRSVEEMQQEYEKSRETGIPMFELHSQRKMIYRKKYHSNPHIINRYDILNDVEPYLDTSLESLRDQRRDDPASVSLEDFELKQNFNRYVARFERENSPVGQFMPDTPLRSRVELIDSIMRKYVADQIKKQEKEAQDRFEKQQAQQAAFGTPMGNDGNENGNGQGSSGQQPQPQPTATS